jgi:hypothetical protein
MMEVPHAGIDADSVMAELEERAANDFRYADGESKATGTVYMAGDVHRELLNDAYCMFSQANPLHTDLFPSVRRMEAELVAMTASLLGGGHQGVREVRRGRRRAAKAYSHPLHSEICTRTRCVWTSRALAPAAFGALEIPPGSPCFHPLDPPASTWTPLLSARPVHCYAPTQLATVAQCSPSARAGVRHDDRRRQREQHRGRSCECRVHEGEQRHLRA